MESYQTWKNAINSNSNAAWEELYEQYGKKFYSYCLHKWQLNPDEAWDVVYQTLETLVRKLTTYTFNSQAEFDGLLYTILISFLQQQYRKKKVKETDTVYIDFDSETGSQSALSEYLNASAINSFFSSEHTDSPELVRLQEALGSMDSVDKDLLLLRAQNYSYDEIAKLLNIDNNQLKVRHHRAKKKLTDKLLQTTND